ncbi:MAG: dockerin type I repeat-containing protein [Candidatus Zixiibacteriota bacterium]
MPTAAGTPDACAAGLIDGKTPARTLTFLNDFINVACDDSTDSPGDINLNGIGYELADYLLYAEYFLYGFAAWDANPSFRLAQIAASDAHQDGDAISFQDYVYMYRVVIGDAVPFPKPTQSQGPTAYFAHNVSAKSVSASYQGNLAGALFVFDGEITPTFLIPTMDTSSNIVVHRGGQTRFVMPPYMHNSHPSGLWFTYTGTGDLDSVATADWIDQAVPTFIIAGDVAGSCGDVNADGAKNISDAVLLINHIFGGGPAPLGGSSGDVDCNGIITVSDAVYLDTYIFAGGPAACVNCP